MRRQRVTVTVPAGAVAAAEQAVQQGQSPSVSAWVAEAMEQKARREHLKALLTEIRNEIGPASKEDTAWARAVLGL